jgi:hypothetical protein
MGCCSNHARAPRRTILAEDDHVGQYEVCQRAPDRPATPLNEEIE